MQSYLSRRDQFIIEHGGLEASRREYVNDYGDKVPTGYFLFPDGARSHEDSGGTCLDPPDDDIERLRLIVKYQEILHEEAVDAFDDFKNTINAHFDPDFSGVYCGPPYGGGYGDALTELKKRRNAIYRVDRKLNKAKAELDALENPPELKAKRKEQERQDREHRARNNEFLMAVKNLKY